MSVGQITGRVPFAPPQARLLDFVVGNVRRQKCVLFLGAGIHQAPPANSPYSYPQEQRPPLGRELSRMLAADSDFESAIPGEDTSNLRRVALHYEQCFGRAALVDKIADTLMGCSPSPLLQALVSLDFPVIITTNYDHMIERALERVEKRPQIRIYKKPVNTKLDDISAESSPNRPALLKIHGDIGERESIVVTEEDYIHFILRMGDKDEYSPVPHVFRVALQRMPTLFIGYSLTDYNLRALFATLRWRADPANTPPTYSVDLSPDPLVQGVLGAPPRAVNFIIDDMWTVVPRLYQLVKGEEMPR